MPPPGKARFETLVMTGAGFPLTGMGSLLGIGTWLETSSSSWQLDQNLLKQTQLFSLAIMMTAPENSRKEAA